MAHTRHFASDNNAGCHPEILKTLTEINQGHVVAYGDDLYTERAEKKFKEVFGSDIQVFFVFNGTAANVLALSTLAKPYNAVICSSWAHLNLDECGAPEKFTGSKLLTIPSSDGKITVGGIKKHLRGLGEQHHVQPSAVSLTQVTEMGTVYSAQEIKDICDFAHENNLRVHMDGARIANAAVSMKMSLRECTRDLGVDVLSFGGTKNGLLFGEAVVFFDKSLAENFKFIRKQSMQLASKMRFVSAQFERLLTNDLWKKNAENANTMAQYLFEKVKSLPGVTVPRGVQANSVFVRLPKQAIPKIQKEYFFYVWDEDQSEVRWMTAFDTTKEDVDKFIEVVKKNLSS